MDNTLQILEAFRCEVSPLTVLDWVFDQPELRKHLIVRAKDLITKHEFAQIGNRARNAKLTPAERSASARHAAGRRRKRDLVATILSRNGNGNGAVPMRKEPSSHKEMAAMVAESLREMEESLREVGFVER